MGPHGPRLGPASRARASAPASRSRDRKAARRCRAPRWQGRSSPLQDQHQRAESFPVRPAPRSPAARRSPCPARGLLPIGPAAKPSGTFAQRGSAAAPVTDLPPTGPRAPICRLALGVPDMQRRPGVCPANEATLPPPDRCAPTSVPADRERRPQHHRPCLGPAIGAKTVASTASARAIQHPTTPRTQPLPCRIEEILQAAPARQTHSLSISRYPRPSWLPRHRHKVPPSRERTDPSQPHPD